MKWIIKNLGPLWPWRTYWGEEETNVRPMLRKIMAFTFYVTLLLYICLLFFFCKGRGFVISSVSIVIAAYFISGCILGFIFGIPKKLQNQPQTIRVDKDGKPIADGTPNTAGYTDNTSLEEISDWITKIVIGLSLVQFREIQKMLQDAATHITASLKTAIDCGGKDCVCPVDFFTFSYALIIFYFAVGAIIGYLWTRVVFPQILKEKDNRLNGMNARKAEKFDEIVRTANQGTHPLTDTRLAPAPISGAGGEAANTALDFVKLPDTTTSFYEIGDDAEIRKILVSRPTGPNKDDPQKGRWGGLVQAGVYKLSAEVKGYGIPGLYSVKLMVSKTDGSLINGRVAFALHDSFDPDTKFFECKNNREVFTEVIAYEAFAVGAICIVDDVSSAVLLELDLNTLPNLPGGFRWS